MPDLPSQTDIDAAYSVKIFLDHHPGRQRSIPVLALESDISEERLRKAFLYIFDETLDQYWKKVQWKQRSGTSNSTN